ncbi:MAG: hypothetical protein DMF87_22185 [Acidobacteria bacterium]|nr:MAG: hypothetical protein DMF88_24295 [Acidobacteriota bacterium]PYR74608.1 MAG: hypothetical protein DMF87_22185 [Acidobacteriota bacterium]
MALAGCGDGVRSAAPTAPTPTVVPSLQPVPPSLTGTYPPITGPARVFVYRDSPYPRVAAYTLTSRFVLYDDGRFALQYEQPVGEYRGTYTASDGVVTFNWEGWSVAGPWGAEATLSGDVLNVRYNLIMQLTDFEDADYVRNQ